MVEINEENPAPHWSHSTMRSLISTSWTLSLFSNVYGIACEMPSYFRYSPPHLINFPAIAAALRVKEVTQVVAFTSVGSLKAKRISIGDLVVPGTMTACTHSLTFQIALEDYVGWAKFGAGLPPPTVAINIFYINWISVCFCSWLDRSLLLNSIFTIVHFRWLLLPV